MNAILYSLGALLAIFGLALLVVGFFILEGSVLLIGLVSFMLGAGLVSEYENK